MKIKQVTWFRDDGFVLVDSNGAPIQDTDDDTKTLFFSRKVTQLVPIKSLNGSDKLTLVEEVE